MNNGQDINYTHLEKHFYEDNNFWSSVNLSEYKHINCAARVLGNRFSSDITLWESTRIVLAIGHL